MCCNNNGFFGGGNCCWIIILILLICCCCGNDNGGLTDAINGALAQVDYADIDVLADQIIPNTKDC